MNADTFSERGQLSEKIYLINMWNRFFSEIDSEIFLKLSFEHIRYWR